MMKIKKIHHSVQSALTGSTLCLDTPNKNRDITSSAIYAFCIFFLLFALTGVASASVSINNVGVSAIKTNSAVISWDSTVAGTSQIEYGTTISYGSITQEEPLTYFHNTQLTGLSTGITYHYRIRSKDYYGVETVSPDYTFTTRTQAQLDTGIKAARADGQLPKTYYVSTTGSDSNQGTQSSPFKTMKYALSKTLAGD